MSKLTEALEVLKHEIEEIGGKTYSRTDPIEESDALSLFANPDLLPASIPPAPKAVSSKSKEGTLYVDNVLQSLWNIADIASGATSRSAAILLAISNGTTLTANFKYLDAHTDETETQTVHSWVPKIIDEKTYAAGQALIKFLNTTINDNEALSLLPDKIKAGARTDLTRMKVLLEARLKVYEIHRDPVKTAQAAKYVKIKIERRNKFNSLMLNILPEIEEKYGRYAKFKNCIKTLNKAVTNNWALFQSAELSNKDLEEIEKIIKGQLTELETLTQPVKLIKEWHEENLRLDLPPEIQSTPLIRALALEPAQEVQKAWLGLFNTNDAEIINNAIDRERIATLLNSDYQAIGLSDIAVIIQAQLDVLNDKKEVIRYKEQMEELVHDLRNITFPAELIADTDKGDNFLFVESTEKKTAVDIEAAIQAYNVLISNLKKYEEILEAHEQGLKEKSSLVKNSVDKAGPNLEFAYQQVLNELKVQEKISLKTKKVTKKLVKVKDLIQKAKAQQKELKAELTRQSEEKREQALAAARDKVVKNYKQLSSQGSLVSRQRVALDKFTYEQYNPAIPLIEAKYNPQIAEEEEKIDGLLKRQKFLQTAKEKLEEYRAEILNAFIYVPANKIPKDELLQYLENDNTRDLDLIDDMYSDYENASGFGGILANTINYLERYTASSPTDADMNLQSLANSIIGKKLAKIEKEVKEIETALEAHSKQMDELKNEKEAKLAALESQKRDKSQRVTIAEREHKFAKMEHQLSIIARYNLSFEYRLQGIEEALKKASDKIAEIIPMSSSEAKEVFESNKNLLDAPTQQLNIIDKLDGRISDLQNLIASALTTQKNQLKELEDLIKSFPTMSELVKKKEQLIKEKERLINELQKPQVQTNKLGSLLEKLNDDLAQLESTTEQLEKLIEVKGRLINKLQKRQAQKDKLDSLLEKLNDDVVQLKSTTGQLGKLIQIEDDYSKLLERTQEPNLSLQSKQQLVEEINREIEKNSSFLTEMSAVPNEFVNDRYNSILNSDNKLKEFVLITQLEIDKEEELFFLEEELSKQRLSWEDQLTLLSNQYFGTDSEIGGFFGDYLEERKNTFWLRDAFSVVAAVFLGLFDYKTEAQQREDYLTKTLQPALERYQKEPDLETYDKLVEVLNKGKSFSPRAESGEGYNNSLKAKVISLKGACLAIEDKRRYLEDERRNLEMEKDYNSQFKIS